MTSDKSGPAGTEQLEAQAEQTREQLADAVEQLAARTDVKQRFKTKAATMAAAARDRMRPVGRKTAELGRQRRVQAGALTGAVALAGLVARRRRS